MRCWRCCRCELYRRDSYYGSWDEGSSRRSKLLMRRLDSPTPMVATWRQHQLVQREYDRLVSCEVCEQPIFGRASFCLDCQLVCHARCLAQTVESAIFVGRIDDTSMAQLSCQRRQLDESERDWSPSFHSRLVEHPCASRPGGEGRTADRHVEVRCERLRDPNAVEYDSALAAPVNIIVVVVVDALQSGNVFIRPMSTLASRCAQLIGASCASIPPSGLEVCLPRLVPPPLRHLPAFLNLSSHRLVRLFCSERVFFLGDKRRRNGQPLPLSPHPFVVDRNQVDRKA
uniref:Phorbol-ester/DAG-type domain-containing protein n=1 Tax=Plectus sambesii TaxID=2011161 RepID=A0A914VCA7_9BILA